MSKDVTPVGAGTGRTRPGWRGHGFDMSGTITTTSRGCSAHRPGWLAGSSHNSQLVVQHLQFTHRAVRGVKANGTYRWRSAAKRAHHHPKAPDRGCGIARGEQRVSAVSWPRQTHRCAADETWPGWRRHRRARPAGGQSRALAAPGGQQRVGMLVHVPRPGHHRQVGSVACGLAAALGFEQLAPFHDVAPIVRQGLGTASSTWQCRLRAASISSGTGQMAHAVHHHAPRHPARSSSPCSLSSTCRCAGQGWPAGAHPASAPPPARAGLPALIGRQGSWVPSARIASCGPASRVAASRCGSSGIDPANPAKRAANWNPTVGFLGRR